MSLDHTHWHRMTLGDVSLEHQIATLFKEQAQQQKRVWETTDDPLLLKEALHTLRGSAVGIGAFGLEEHLACWEKDLSCIQRRRAVERSLEDVLLALKPFLKIELTC